MDETLVVASKVKKFIKASADMNTSGSVMDALTKIVRNACQEAVENARRDKRKTVMDRDFNV